MVAPTGGNKPDEPDWGAVWGCLYMLLLIGIAVALAYFGPNTLTIHNRLGY